MLAITLALLICQHMSASWSTRLPLEVYELTPAVAAAAEANTAGAPAALADDSTNAGYLKHKTLEYATINAKTLTAATAAATNRSASNNESATDVAMQQQSTVAERRRSRQMLDIIEQQQQQYQQHRFAHDALHLQKQQLHQQQQQSKLHGHLKDVRILYQVGESEDDLPLCAPNAVCSKIDLYETPWIERQCRCPEVNRQPNVIVHHHHHHSNSAAGSSGAGNKDNSNNVHNDKFRSFYEREKLLQHKRLLVSDFQDKKFESLHLKKLMQKLGAVYEDDLQLQPSDLLLEHEYNDALPSLEDMDEISDNEFPHTPRRNYESSTHMRHSGHMSSHNRAKESAAAFIGGCPSGLGIEDGHTIADKTRHYKLCQPVHKLPVCKHFRDYTWTLTTSAELNVTEQIVHCRCPKNSVTYLTKREPAADGSNGYTYLFACSPLTRIRCQRKQPCKLFTVRKRQEFLDEVNINALCQCPKGHRCPSHHTQSGVIPGESFLEDNIQTYSGYCMAND